MTRTKEEILASTDDPEIRAALLGDETTLPPAGGKRDDVKAMRQDILDEATEIKAEQEQRFAISPDNKVFREDREIQHSIRRNRTPFYVSGARDDRCYCWANWKSREGYDVMARRFEGWQAVTGDEPEAKEHVQGPEKTRRIGDVLLMWMPKDRWEREIHADNEKRRLDQQRAIPAEVEELAEKYAGLGVRVTTDGEKVRNLLGKSNN